LTHEESSKKEKASSNCPIESGKFQAFEKEDREDDICDDKDQSSPLRVLEIGCGVGNGMFPLLDAHAQNDDFFLYGCDYSRTAIELVQSDRRYDHGKKCLAFVHDISDSTSNLTKIIPSHSIDIILLVFVLSAIPREKMSVVVDKIKTVLKPGGRVLFRDYGLYDLAQLRLKPQNWISGHQYRRAGDQTLMFFFELEEVTQLFAEPAWRCIEAKYDRRLLVNRKRQLTMYRVWVQAKFIIK
jgi:SAM-dependent methyltransferase